MAGHGWRRFGLWLGLAGACAVVTHAAVENVVDGGPRRVRGEVGAVTGDADAFGLGTESYEILPGTNWRSVDGRWHSSGLPECLQPMTRGAVIEAALVTSGERTNNILWLKCLSLPTERYG